MPLRTPDCLRNLSGSAPGVLTYKYNAGCMCHHAWVVADDRRVVKDPIDLLEATVDGKSGLDAEVCCALNRVEPRNTSHHSTGGPTACFER